MALELRQQLKLSQQLVMTPQLQQAIKLLQLSRLDLVETVHQEMLENPFLEEKFEEIGGEEPVHSGGAGEMSREVEVVDKAETPLLATASGNPEDMMRTADWEDYLGEFSSSSRHAQVREAESQEQMSFEGRHAGKPSLEGHLEWQLRLSNFSDRDKDIGEYIIGNLNSNGYLQATAEDVAEMAGATAAEVESVLVRMQLFDPVGVAARTPQECLLVQLRFHGLDTDPILVELVREHLEDLEKKRYKPLCRK